MVPVCQDSQWIASRPMLVLTDTSVCQDVYHQKRNVLENSKSRKSAFCFVKICLWFIYIVIYLSIKVKEDQWRKEIQKRRRWHDCYVQLIPNVQVCPYITYVTHLTLEPIIKYIPSRYHVSLSLYLVYKQLSNQSPHIYEK